MSVIVVNKRVEIKGEKGQEGVGGEEGKGGNKGKKKSCHFVVGKLLL